MQLTGKDKEEVDQELIQRHPLYYVPLPLHEIFPWLERCRKKRAQQQKDKEKEQILGDLQPRSDGNKALEDQLSMQTKGFNSLGYGTVAYFDFHESLICLFFVVCLITIPSLMLFSS